jgi:hypothetical protein
MTFIQKVESFYMQLQYSIAIDSDCLISSEKGCSTFHLEYPIFIKAIDNFGIDYPFSHETKIVEIKRLAINERIPIDECLTIINEKKKFYWALGILMIDGQSERYRKAYKALFPESNDIEISKAYSGYTEYLEDIRNGYHELLVKKIESIKDSDYYNEQITKDDNSKRTIRKNMTAKKKGYHSVFDTNRLDELYDVFVEKKYIHPDSNRESFKAIFFMCELPEDFEPPLWIDDEKLLVYLYTESRFKRSENVKWLGFPKLFKNEDGEYFKYDSLKSSKHDNKLAPPKKADELKKIIECYSLKKIK